MTDLTLDKLDFIDFPQLFDAEGSFSDLLSFLDVIVLPGIWAANKHDVQLGEVPEGEEEEVKTISRVPLLNLLIVAETEPTSACCTPVAGRHPGSL